MKKINNADSILIKRSPHRIGSVSWVNKIFFTVCFSVAVVLITGNPGSSQPAQIPSETKEAITLNGPAILDTRCSICHSVDVPKRTKKTPEQWEQTVNRMIDKGARLTGAEKNLLLDHLGRTYGKSK